MNNPDMSQYLNVFLDEAQEQLELFETHVIGLERSSDPDAELQVLFRAAHTLKGSSRTMGFAGIGDLTHEMENVLDALRSHSLALTTPAIDILLDCLDMLKLLIGCVASAGNEEGNDTAKVRRLVSELNALSENKAVPIEAPVQTVVQPASEEQCVLVRIRLVEDCPMKAVRAILILGVLQNLGHVIATSPSAELLEDEKFENEFEVALQTDSPVPDIEAVVTQLLDVAGAEIVDNRSKAEAKDETPAAGTGKAPAPQSSSTTVRVDVGRLDKLLNLVGELVTDRTQLITLASSLQARYPEDEVLSTLLEGVNRFGRVTSELQEEIMKSRMLPINGVFQRMPRMVRDLAQKTNKDVDFEMLGGETELDRSVLEVLGDPLIHILRNAVDHGVETPEKRQAHGKSGTGHVRMSARQERSQIVVEISDDGQGIDPAVIRAAAVRKGVITEAVAEAMSDREALYLIFAPGLSTANELSDISGRGVGMDIVRSNVERIGGRVVVESKLGQGSRFLIYLPLTLAIVRAILVLAEGCTYALPLTSVTEMISLTEGTGDMKRCSAGGQAALMLRGQTMPLANFADVLRGDRSAVDPSRIDANAHAVIVRHGDGQTALSVDELQGETEVVIKPIGSMLSEVAGISGASILGDGRVALVVDPSKALEAIYRSPIAA